MRDREDIPSSNCRKWSPLPCVKSPSSTLASDPKDGFIWGRDSLEAYTARLGAFPLNLFTQSGLSHSSQSIFQYFPLWSVKSRPEYPPGYREIPCKSLPLRFPPTPSSSTKPAVPSLLWEALSGCPSTSVTAQSLESCHPRPLGI